MLFCLPFTQSLVFSWGTGHRISLTLSLSPGAVAVLLSWIQLGWRPGANSLKRGIDPGGLCLHGCPCGDEPHGTLQVPCSPAGLPAREPSGREKV